MMIVLHQLMAIIMKVVYDKTSINKKVYFKYPSCPDTLIYDFSKQVGHTLNVVYNSSDCYSGWVSFPVLLVQLIPF